MNQQSVSLGGIMNSFKWVVVLLLIGVGVVGNYHFSEQPLLVRLVGLIILACLAVFVALQTQKGKHFWRFAQDSRTELRKVVWPSRKETVQTTILVLSVVAIVGLLLWGVDTVLLKSIAWLIGYRGS
jgi:preprotein translocase subunit SecE